MSGKNIPKGWERNWSHKGKHMVENQKILHWVPTPKLTIFWRTLGKDSSETIWLFSLRWKQSLLLAQPFTIIPWGIAPARHTQSQHTHPARLHGAGFPHHQSPVSKGSVHNLPALPGTGVCVESTIVRPPNLPAGLHGLWEGEEGYLLMVEKKCKL